VTGARQVGKTFTIRKCLKDNNCRFVEINLIQNPMFAAALSQSVTVDELKLNLSALLDVSFIGIRWILRSSSKRAVSLRKQSTI